MKMSSLIPLTGESFGLARRVSPEEILVAIGKMSIYYLRAKLFKKYDQRLEFPTRASHFLKWVKKSTGKDVDEIRISGVFQMLVRDGPRHDVDALKVQLRKVVLKLPDGTWLHIPNSIKWEFSVREVLVGV